MNKLPTEFCEAWLNKSHVVLGKTLQPYCLYHVLALHTIESPAVLGGRMSLEDLEKAVLICSEPLPTTQKEDAQYSAKVSALFSVKAKGFLSRLALRRWHKKYGPHYLRELIQFHYYIRDFSTSPQVNNELSGKGSGANHILSRAGFYIYHTGASVEYAFSLPLGQLNHLCSYFSAMNSGKITFLEEGEAKADIRRIHEEYLKRGDAQTVDTSGH